MTHSVDEPKVLYLCFSAHNNIVIVEVSTNYTNGGIHFADLVSKTPKFIADPWLFLYMLQVEPILIVVKDGKTKDHEHLKFYG